MSKFDQIAKGYFEALNYWLHPILVTTGDAKAMGPERPFSVDVQVFLPPKLEKRFEEMRLLMLLALQETKEKAEEVASE